MEESRTAEKRNTHVLLDVVTADTTARAAASMLSVPCTPARELQKDDGQTRAREIKKKETKE
jgi:hypothetical protein